MTREIRPLKGPQALKALNAYQSLLLGLCFLPEHVAKDYATEFLPEFKALPVERQESWFRKAVAFVTLSADEIGALISFATDRNGVPYQAANKDNLDVDEIFDICVAVCMAISRIKIDLISEEEQKKNRERNDRSQADVPEAPR